VGSGNRSAGSASAAKRGKTAARRENVGGEFKGQGQNSTQIRPRLVLHNTSSFILNNSETL
jgi:PPE-repeat protein